MRFRSSALIMVAFGCNAADPPVADPGAMALESVDAAAPCDSAAACKLVASGATKGSAVVTKTLTCCLAWVLAACVPVVGPVTPPGGAGGASPAGGAGPGGGGSGGATADGMAMCVAAATKSPGVVNLAKQSGVTVTQAVATTCESPAVRACYAEGRCK